MGQNAVEKALHLKLLEDLLNLRLGRTQLRDRRLGLLDLEFGQLHTVGSELPLVSRIQGLTRTTQIKAGLVGVISCIFKIINPF